LWARKNIKKMKKLLVFAILTVSFVQFINAQKFGIKGGVSDFKINPNGIEIQSPNDAVQGTLDLAKAQNGYFFGAYARFGKFIHLQPEVLFNQNTVDYKLTNSDGVFSISEKNQSVEVPLLLGLKIGPLRAQAGPVGIFHAKSTSNWDKTDGFSQNFDKMKLGTVIGVGLNLGRHLTFDLRWQGDLNKFGDHIVVQNEQINFDKNARRVSFSIGYTF
jgi:Outer membrane protein beta-barrel domain